MLGGMHVSQHDFLGKEVLPRQPGGHQANGQRQGLNV